MFFKHLSLLSISLFLMFSLSSCVTKFDPGMVHAKAGSPESAKIEVVSIPYNPNMPRYVVAVEPFVFSRTLAANEGSSINFRRGGEDLAAQLVTVLTHNGNISVVDSGLKKSEDGMYHTRLHAGEVGPFVIRATVTEFTENAESSSKKNGGSLGWVGAVAGLAGAATGKDGLMWGGAGLAAANPTYKNDQRARKGMVALDIRVVDGRTGRIVRAFKSSGTFMSASAKSGFSLFGIGKEEHQFAQSVIGQAIRAALNDASQKIHQTLSMTRV